MSDRDFARLVLHIDRVVLRGVAAAERDAVVDALQAELARAFAEPGAAQQWATGGHRESLRLRFRQEAMSPAPDAAQDARPGAALGRGAAAQLVRGGSS